MALLDFMKNRPQPQPAVKPQAATPRPEPAKRDVAQVLSMADLAKARQTGDLINKATMHVRSQSRPPEGGSNAALLQKQNNQDKTQAAMSPTDRFAGQTQLQNKSRGWER